MVNKGTLVKLISTTWDVEPMSSGPQIFN